jgi:hypothetical protein
MTVPRRLSQVFYRAEIWLVDAVSQWIYELIYNHVASQLLAKRRVIHNVTHHLNCDAILHILPCQNDLIFLIVFHRFFKETRTYYERKVVIVVLHHALQIADQIWVEVSYIVR